MDPFNANRVATAYERIATVLEAFLAMVQAEREEDKARHAQREDDDPSPS